MTTSAAPRRVLIVDDELNHRRMLSLVLSNHGYSIEAVGNGQEALERLGGEDEFGFVLLDLRMPGLDGLSTLHEIHRRRHRARVIIMTAYAEVRSAVEAVKLGAVDYLTKPIDVKELMGIMEREASGPVDSDSGRRRAGAGPPAEGGLHFGMVGESAPMREIYALIERIAPSEATALIHGESGTGKELVAEALHRNGPRADRPMLSVNCAALPESLLESELFGHVRGAFTGAERDRVGRFEAADRGTLFLDEIGDLPPPAQAKMLRVLQQGTFEPIGSNETRKVDVRVIAATNKDLAREVEEGRFRQDLYYRLNIVTLRLPPLRERTEDIPALANHFIAKHAPRNRKEIEPASDEFLQCLLEYEWPGNVRELENAVERSVILALSDVLTPDLLPPPMRPAVGRYSPPEPPRPKPALVTLQEAERDLILATLEAVGGNQSQAARQLGISRQTLINKLKQYK